MEHGRGWISILRCLLHSRCVWASRLCVNHHLLRKLFVLKKGFQQRHSLLDAGVGLKTAQCRHSRVNIKGQRMVWPRHCYPCSGESALHPLETAFLSVCGIAMLDPLFSKTTGSLICSLCSLKCCLSRPTTLFLTFNSCNTHFPRSVSC